MIMKRDWKTIREYSDILFDFFEGIARITINRPEVYNAFRPQTNAQILDALAYCRDTPEVRVVVLTGAVDSGKGLLVEEATRRSVPEATSIISRVAATVIPTALPV